MVVLLGSRFSVTENKTKGEVDFKYCWLTGKDAAELFLEVGRTDRRQAEIVPVLKLVLAAETRTDLLPVLSVHLSNILIRA